MRPVNLIPAEERRGEKAPLRTGPVAYVVVGVLALVLVVITVVALTGNKISDRKSEVAALRGQVAAEKARAKQLTAYTNFASMQQARDATVASLAHSRFDWERVLNELAMVIPDDVWLTGVTAKASADAGGAATASSAPGAESIAGPSLDIQGCADGHEAVAKFTAALRDVDGITRVTVMSSDRPDASGDTGGSSSSSSSSDSSAGSLSCSTRNFVSTFEVVAAFDAVAPTATAPAAPAPSGASATPASAGTQPSNDASQQGTESTAVVSGTGGTP
jgi:Tfp pilus assembly protein PilN